MMAWDNIISRGIWTVIQPSNFLLLMLILSFILVHLCHKNSKTKNIAGKIRIACLTALALAGFTNIPTWLLWPIEERFYEYTNQSSNTPYSGIIVLAGSEKTSVSTAVDQPTMSDASERLTETAMLARKYPTLPIIHSGGGRKSENEWSENDVAERFFKDAGVDVNRIRFERNSYNTHTNAIESGKLIKANENEKWLLVTSAFHMPRSVGAFRKAGVPIQPYPVGYLTTLKYQGIFNFEVSENLVRLDWAIHEYIGLFAYYTTGRSSSFFPSDN